MLESTTHISKWMLQQSGSAMWECRPHWARHVALKEPSLCHLRLCRSATVVFSTH